MEEKWKDLDISIELNHKFDYSMKTLPRKHFFFFWEGIHGFQMNFEDSKVGLAAQILVNMSYRKI